VNIKSALNGETKFPIIEEIKNTTSLSVFYGSLRDLKLL